MLDQLITTLQSGSPFVVLVLMTLSAFIAVLLALRLFGAAGLYVLMSLSVIAANIQVLKLVQFGFYTQPVALGTVLFSVTYFCTDILNEYYGRAAAQRGVAIGFAASVFWLVVMILTISYAPLSPEKAGDGFAWALPMHGHIAAIFTPLPTFLLASLAAYLISQMFDVWVFDRLRQAMRGRQLWLRNNVSTALSALLDNIVFSSLAFMILAAQPVDMTTLIFTFILGSYALRLVIALLDTPFMYLARWLLPVQEKTL